MQAAVKQEAKPVRWQPLSTKFPLAHADATVYDDQQGEKSPRQSALCHGISIGNSQMVEDHIADQDLIRRVAARDRQAFEALYVRFAPRVVRYLSSQIRQREIVEEALDDVMMVVWETAARYNGTSRLSTWIFGIAHFKALKARARAAKVDTSYQESDHGGIVTHGPEDVISERELTDAIRGALNGLPSEQRAVVELAFYHDRSYAEIAEILKCPVNTVKTRMFHARQRLAWLFRDKSTIDKRPR
jgi:RNA polymerase sigma factor (sigma-70 family)